MNRRLCEIEGHDRPDCGHPERDISVVHADNSPNYWVDIGGMSICFNRDELEELGQRINQCLERFKT